MEEIESFTEKLEEDMHEVAEEAKENWLKLSALISALFAVMAAISGLQSGQAANKAMLEQIAAANSWNYYQAKGIKAMIAELPGTDTATQKAAKYHDEQQTIMEEAKTHSETSEKSLNKHEILARAVTFFQVAIALTAISVLTRRRAFLLVSAGLGLLGFLFFVQGTLA